MLYQQAEPKDLRESISALDSVLQTDLCPFEELEKTCSDYSVAFMVLPALGKENTKGRELPDRYVKTI